MADEQQIKAYVDASADIAFGTHTDQQIFDHINEKSETRWNPVTSAQIYESIVPADFPTDQTQQVRVDRILGLSGEIATAPGAQARTELISIFGPGSATITALAALASVAISRAEAAGIGEVKMGIVALARNF